MEAVWGAILSILFVLATLSGYNVGGPSTSEQKEQYEKLVKEQKEQYEKNQKEWQEQQEKQQKEQKEKQQKEQKEKSEKSGKKETSARKQKSAQADRRPMAKALKEKNDPCSDNCPDEWRLRH